MPEFRILSIFNRYLQYGGEETMAAKIAETLSQKALVREYNYSTQEWLDAGKFTAPFRGLKNRHVIRQLRLLQREYKFDFWLIHNVFPAMSPAVYREARRLNVPVIHMLHNYRFGCLNGLLFREGRECRECLKGSFLPGVKNRCWQGKLIPSLYSACFQTAARKSGILHNAARFIALSGRHAELLKTTGIPEEKTSILPLFVETHLLPYVPAPEGGDILFVGRLTPEKGLMPVLQAWERLDTERRLVIAGDGPQRQELENWVKEHNARNILFKGFVPLEEQEQLWNTASASIAPSAWQEAGATTILESLGRGRPVIAFAKGARLRPSGKSSPRMAHESGRSRFPDPYASNRPGHSCGPDQRDGGTVPGFHPGVPVSGILAGRFHGNCGTSSGAGQPPGKAHARIMNP